MFMREVPGTLATPVDAFNLLASAERPQDSGWQNGITWRSELCADYQGIPYCGEPSGEAPEGNDAIEHAMPVVLRTSDTCTTLSARDSQGRAERRADAITSYVVARELWTGEISRADQFVWSVSDETPQANNHLMDGTASVVVLSAATLIGKIAELEEAARSALLGQRVLIHAPLSVVSQLPDLHRVGNELRTNGGTVVVGDAGYTGQGPYTAGTAEEQSVSLTGAPTGGEFTLTFDGETTVPLPFNATAGNMEVSLNALPNLHGVEVTGAGPWTVTFPASLGDVEEMTGDGSGLTGGAAPDVAVATTTPGVDPAPTAGTWVYATGPVSVRLEAVEVLDGAATVDRTTNRRTTVAQRLFLVSYDSCGAFAAQLTA